ncbi:MAG: bifunctional (p)ppGpp synthetase/guanosine-3',5'-bis(diphosphate) 3'-pyrophosphohydrolase [Rickettsiaceae bacterium]|nr:bifunctional (p)ppGpp synthetase/guanosine-3',5'-bis(diphosphate) 3'-pyrophosphohydrolase [Rickettsiaceae bacterium]
MDYSESCLHTIRLIEKLKSLDIQNFLDFELINKAICFAKEYHTGQFRKSGEPFYTHPLEVAYIVSDYNLKTEVIVTSILHDILEDTEATESMLAEAFGSRIAEMVDRLTRDRSDGSKLSVEQVLRNAWFQNDKEVVLIKIVDRIHNISTVNYLSPEKQKEQVTETIKNFLIFAEELSLHEVSDFLYKQCVELNIELGVISLSNIKKKKTVFHEESILPFPIPRNT